MRGREGGDGGVSTDLISLAASCFNDPLPLSPGVSGFNPDRK